MTILVGHMLARVEWAGVKEEHMTRAVLAKRALSAVLMMLAVAAYLAGR